MITSDGWMVEKMKKGFVGLTVHWIAVEEKV